MTLGKSKVVLTTIWGIGCLLFLMLLVLKTPQFGKDAADVWKKAPSFIAPILLLLTTFLFGSTKLERDEKLHNPLSFWGAVSISIAHLTVLFLAMFGWSKPMVDNIETAGLFMHYFSALTIAALNFFFLGVTQSISIATPPPGQTKR